MKSFGNAVLAAALGLLLLAAVAPSLIALSSALFPLVIACGVVAIVVRLVFVHTRKW